MENNKNIYNTLIANAKNYKNLPAINYYGSIITYEKLIQKIEMCASAFDKIGVKKGDVVTICLPMVPEAIYTMYALNKLGAKINIINPIFSLGRTVKGIEGHPSKYLVALDEFRYNFTLDTLTSIKGFEEVISVSLNNSRGGLLKQLEKLQANRYLSWDDFIAKAREIVPGNNEDIYEPFIYITERNDNCYTEISNNDFEDALVTEMGEFALKKLVSLPISNKDTLLNGVYNSLCKGEELLLDNHYTSLNASKMIPKLITKYEPDEIITTSVVMEQITKNSSIPDHFVLSFLRKLILSDVYSDFELNRIKNYLERHRFKGNVIFNVADENLSKTPSSGKKLVFAKNNR